MCTTASSATSATHRSEACSAMQCSLAPRIACIRAARSPRRTRTRARACCRPPPSDPGNSGSACAAGCSRRSSPCCAAAARRPPAAPRGRTASRSATVGSAASSSIVVSAPTCSVPPSRVIPRSGRRVMSTSRSGSSTPSFSIKSSWVVPPARYWASGSALASATATATSSARMYSNGRIATRPPRGDLSDRGDDVWIRAATADVAAHELADLLIGPARPSASRATADMIWPGVQ